MVFHKLGLAITFSPNALSLLKTAKRLQNLIGSQLYFIHVGERNSSTEESLGKLLRSAGIEDDSYELTWRNGDPAKSIINFTFDNGIDLLIAGALEKESMLKYYIGSVARTIMRETPCSVLILTHPEGEPKPFKKFCASVEFSEMGEYAIRKAFDFAILEKAEEFVLIKEFQVPGLAVTISDTGSTVETEQKRIDWQNEEAQKLEVFAKELNLSGLDLKTVCVYGKHGWASKSYVEENKSDLLVVPSPPRRLRLFDRIFQHDIEFILKQLPCNLLIVKTGSN